MGTFMGIWAGFMTLIFFLAPIVIIGLMVMTMGLIHYQSCSECGAFYMDSGDFTAHLEEHKRASEALTSTHTVDEGMDDEFMRAA